MQEGVTAGVFAEDEVTAKADFAGIEAFVVAGEFDDTVGMQPGFMGKDLLADDRFPFRHRSAARLADVAGDLDKAAGVDPGVDPAAVLERHHHLFESSIAGAFAEAVHRGIDEAGAGADAGDGIGGRHAKIVVGVDFDLQLRNASAQGADIIVHGKRIENAESVAVAEAIRAHALGDLQQLDEKVEIGAAGIFAADGDIKVVLFSKTEGDFQLLLDPCPIFAQLAGDLQVGDREGKVDGADTAGQGGLNIRDQRPVPGEESAAQIHVDKRADTFLLFTPHRRNAAFEFMDADLVEHGGDAFLLLQRKDDAGGLFTVAQGGIVDDDGAGAVISHGGLRKTEKPRDQKTTGRRCQRIRRRCRR